MQRVRRRGLKRLILSLDLEYHFQLDRSAERKACYSVNQPAGALIPPENVLQQLRSGVSDFRLIADISGGRHRNAETDDPFHFVERSQMLPRDSQDVERREAGSFASLFHTQLRAYAADELRPVTFRGKHPAQKQQIARPHRFHVGTERLRRRGEIDSDFFQSLLGIDEPRAVTSYHTIMFAASSARCASLVSQPAYDRFMIPIKEQNDPIKLSRIRYLKSIKIYPLNESFKYILFPSRGFYGRMGSSPCIATLPH